MNEIDVVFYIYGQRHSSRRTSFVPRKGDRVSLKDGYYEVMYCHWDFSSNEMNPQKAVIQLKKIGEE